jgi:ADP-ribose pyrophosphatase
MPRRPECIGSEPVLEARWITVRRHRYQPDLGRDPIEYYVTETADIALVVPITRRRRFVLVRQWKLPIERWSLEFPAGAIASGPPLANARRELVEETGFAGGQWRKLGSVFPDTGRSRNRVHVFLATGVERAREPEPDAVEIACGLSTIEVGRRALFELVKSGQVQSAGTLAALALLQAR